jgi:hypothetical protein
VVRVAHHLLQLGKDQTPAVHCKPGAELLLGLGRSWSSPGEKGWGSGSLRKAAEEWGAHSTLALTGYANNMQISLLPCLSQ